VKVAGLLLLLVCCGSTPKEPEAQLMLDGAVKVTVDRFGPVVGPTAVLSTGDAPEGLVIAVEDAGVARVEDGVVIAVGPGESNVKVAWKEQSASWVIAVEPAARLAFRNAPTSIETARPTPLHIEAVVNGENVDPGKVEWTSSSPEVATVDEAGIVTGVAAGTAWITVRSGRNEAMIELVVE
jgi:hypothetical protein